jgi:chromosome segregation ATPase
MDLLVAALKEPFVWGLLLGLLVAGFVWKSGRVARKTATREIKRLEAELRDMGNHLNTQLKINASGNQSVQEELESLRKQNETLRVNLATLQAKPGRAEQRQLRLQETAISAMRAQAPGFATAWEQALRDAEREMTDAESGLLKLVRRVVPGIGRGGTTPEAESTNEPGRE